MSGATSVSDDAQNVAFLLDMIATAGAFKPDFEATSHEFGINNAHNAQRRFKFIVEKMDRYTCKKNLLVKKTTTAAGAATENTEKKSGQKGKSPKKRAATEEPEVQAKRNKSRHKSENSKMIESIDEANDNVVDGEETLMEEDATPEPEV